jgi:predicted RNase H-like HicB family nuclease
MKYTIIAAQAEDLTWSALAPDLPGLLLVGDTYEELIMNASESITIHLQATKAAGFPIPMPSSHAAEVEVAA